jgi:hypothetical protein
MNHFNYAVSVVSASAVAIFGNKLTNGGKLLNSPPKLKTKDIELPPLSTPVIHNHYHHLSPAMSVVSNELLSGECFDDLEDFERESELDVETPLLNRTWKLRSEAKEELMVPFCE